MPVQDQFIQSEANKCIEWFGLDQFQPEKAVTSHFLPSSGLLFLRLIFVLYSGAVQWASVYWMASHFEFRHYFGYFTYLTFIGLHAYFVVTFYHHVRYLLSSRRPISFLCQWPMLNYLYVYLYHTVITFNLVTPIVYWGLLSSDFLSKGSDNDRMEWWLTPSVHGASMVMMLVDVFFNRMVVMTRMLLLVLLTVIIYLCLALVYYETEGWLVYSFMDLSQPIRAVMYYSGVFFLFVACFFFQKAIHLLRDFLFQVKAHRGKNKVMDESMLYGQKGLVTPMMDSGIASQITFVNSSSHHLPV
ncbi:hypothetical protein DM01DRAFT_1409565 [Hesseltinella vesiculosa]|uniref:Uncharacterized protein n=1 Tax=Hesseltinella vesiculosa TaxID=101127 RepID=A0A1X2GAF3_9FUNG|nr:hypothetical protein DM01DRAFT_1409565 [Hesseltinella vesiculosa]